MKFMYWNLNDRIDLNVISDLLVSHETDYAVFSECRAIDTVAEQALSAIGYNRITTYSNLNTAHFTKYDTSLCELVHENRHIVAVEVNSVVGPKVLVVGVHLPSNLRRNPKDLYDMAIEYSRTVIELEKKLVNQNTIVVGDFNFSPFEDPMVGHKAFHATMNKKKARTITRIVDDAERPFFYNPMWKLYGKYQDRLGSYYYEGSSSFEYYWHTFDQVIIRPSLIESFKEGELDILDRTDNYVLADPNDQTKIHYSDHLPIKFEMSFI